MDLSAMKFKAQIWGSFLFLSDLILVSHPVL